MQIFMSFYEGQLKQQMLYTANILSAYKSVLKWQSSSFRLQQIFPILMIKILFSQIQKAPGPDFRKVGKSLLSGFILFLKDFIHVLC